MLCARASAARTNISGFRKFRRHFLSSELAFAFRRSCKGRSVVRFYYIFRPVKEYERLSSFFSAEIRRFSVEEAGA